MSINPVSEAGFGGDMSVYERGRPSYPADAVGWLVEGLGVGPGRDVVDLGAGTGKLTRLLVPTGARLTAVEPSEAMREQFARAVSSVPILDGSATAMPLPDESVDAVVVAQAFHWFDVPAATAEIARVLRPRGRVGLIWNERDASVPWVRALNAIFGWDERERQGVPFTVEIDWRDVFRQQAHPRLENLERFVTSHRQTLDVDTLVLRVLSTSYLASASKEEQARVEAAVRARPRLSRRVRSALRDDGVPVRLTEAPTRRPCRDTAPRTGVAVSGPGDAVCACEPVDPRVVIEPRRLELTREGDGQVRIGDRPPLGRRPRTPRLVRAVPRCAPPRLRQIEQRPVIRVEHAVGPERRPLAPLPHALVPVERDEHALEIEPTPARMIPEVPDLGCAGPGVGLSRRAPDLDAHASHVAHRAAAHFTRALAAAHGMPLPLIRRDVVGARRLGRCWNDASNRYQRLVPPDGVRAFTQLAATEHRVCGLTDRRRAFCWSSEPGGPLGEPEDPTGLRDLVEITAADDSFCARRAGGTVVCWGRYDLRGIEPFVGPTPVSTLRVRR